MQHRHTCHRSAQVTLWDMDETRAGGPFPAILEHDIFINCIYLAHVCAAKVRPAHSSHQSIPPFLSAAELTGTHQPKCTSARKHTLTPAAVWLWWSMSAAT